MLNALKTNNLREIAKFDDINLMEIDFKDTLTRTKESIKLDLKAKEMINKGKKQQQDNVNKDRKKPVRTNLISEIRPLQDDKAVNQSGGRKDSKDEFSKEDIRFVVKQGKGDNKSPYESLKESGYIISFDDDIFSKEVVS